MHAENRLILEKESVPFDPKNYHRRSIRLKGYDYTQPGAYFVTICTRDRELLFGNVIDGVMHLNRMGLAVQKTWLDLPRPYPYADLDAFVIMPNHVHGVIVLTDDGGGGSVPRQPSAPEQIQAGQVPLANQVETRPCPGVKPRHGLPEIVRAFKSFSARRVNALRCTCSVPVWQRNYYEHIVRDHDECGRIRQYIENNPEEWDRDIENPTFPRRGGS